MKNKALNIYSEYIAEAKKLYSIAASELKEATKLNDEIKAQDACGKCWLAILKATEALFLKKGVKEEELP